MQSFELAASNAAAQNLIEHTYQRVANDMDFGQALIENMGEGLGQVLRDVIDNGQINQIIDLQILHNLDERLINIGDRIVQRDNCIVDLGEAVIDDRIDIARINLDQGIVGVIAVIIIVDNRRAATVIMSAAATPVSAV